MTNPGRVPDKTTSNIWGDTPLQFCSSPATLCGLNYLYLSWKERQPMQRKGYNVVNKTGYKRNGKGKKKRARKEIEINSPKKKESSINAHTRKTKTLPMLNHSHLLRPGSDAELFMSRT